MLKVMRRFELPVSLALKSPDVLSYLTSTLFILTELNERQAYQMLSLSTVSAHSKARSFFPDADSLKYNPGSAIYGKIKVIVLHLLSFA